MINDIIKLMWEYQRKNSITKKCIDNTIYLRDSLIMNGYEAKVKAVIMTSVSNNELEVCSGHLIIDIGDNKLLDPSYEMNIKPNQQYFDNIKDLLTNYSTIKNDKEFLSDNIKNFMNFCNIANDINIHNKFLLTDREYYHKQHDYIKHNIKSATK